MKLADRLSRRTTRLLAAAVAIGLLVLISWLSLAPPGALSAPRIWDKAQHALAYFALAVPVGIAAGRSGLVLAFVACVAAGAGLESLQAVMAIGRDGSFWDALANAIGAGVGIGLVALLFRRTR